MNKLLMTLFLLSATGLVVYWFYTAFHYEAVVEGKIETDNRNDQADFLLSPNDRDKISDSGFTAERNPAQIEKLISTDEQSPAEELSANVGHFIDANDTAYIRDDSKVINIGVYLEVEIEPAG